MQSIGFPDLLILLDVDAFHEYICSILDTVEFTKHST